MVWACCWVVEWTRSARLGGLVPACPAAVRRNTCPTGARQHNPIVDNPLCKAVGRTAAVVGGGRPPDCPSSALAKLRCWGPGAHEPAWLPMRVRGAELAPTRPPPPKCACRGLGGLLQGPGASRVACLGASANASAAHAGSPSDAPRARRSSPRCPPLTTYSPPHTLAPTQPSLHGEHPAPRLCQPLAQPSGGRRGCAGQACSAARQRGGRRPVRQQRDVAAGGAHRALPSHSGHRRVHHAQPDPRAASDRRGEPDAGGEGAGAGGRAQGARSSELAAAGRPRGAAPPAGRRSSRRAWSK